MSKLFTGSLCLTEILEQAKGLHSAFKKADNGKIYVNFKTWINDEPDKFGNLMSHQLNSSKENAEKEGNIYIGNSKPMEPKITDISQQDVAQIADDLPF